MVVVVVAAVVVQGWVVLYGVLVENCVAKMNANYSVRVSLELVYASASVYCQPSVITTPIHQRLQ